MALDGTIAVLRRAPVIGLFEDDALRVIANVADARRLRQGEVLFRQGDRTDGGYVVTAGSIAVGREGDDKEAAVLGPGRHNRKPAELSVRLAPYPAVSPGHPLAVSVRMESLHFFDEHGARIDVGWR